MTIEKETPPAMIPSLALPFEGTSKLYRP